MDDETRDAVIERLVEDRIKLEKLFADAAKALNSLTTQVAQLKIRVHNNDDQLQKVLKKLLEHENRLPKKPLIVTAEDNSFIRSVQEKSRKGRK